jgi:Ca-activated chloride channel homolog
MGAPNFGAPGMRRAATKSLHEFMRYLTLLPLFLAFAGGAEAQPRSPANDRVSQQFQISVNLDLVALQATVRDHNGGFVSTLLDQDFQVYEDGVRQSIRLFRHEDVPVTVGLVIDHSGSMKNKLSEVITAARTFVLSSNPKDQMFVVNFNEKVSLGLSGEIPFSNRPDELETAIGITQAAGETALYDALSVALGRLKYGSGEKKVLIVISDGGDNASRLRLPDLLKSAAESNAIVYAIGIFDPDDPDKNPDVLRRLALTTGGEAFFPEELKEVVAICERIAGDIRHQYTLGYVSGNTTGAAGYRAVRVVARSAGKNLVVRTRTGYFARDGVK